MPQIRCPKCGQAYDVPGVIAVRLTSSIATCTCGEWLAGSKAAVLARTMDTENIREIDMRPYRVGELVLDPDFGAPAAPPPLRPRSVRITARGTNESINTVFTLHQHPLWIGRKGCHVELAEAELSIRHCSIRVEGEDLVVRDEHSHMGTYLDGQVIDEATLGSGLHLLRLGSALVSVEATEEEGLPVEPIALDNVSVVDESVLAAKRRGAKP